jgi:hypothetical protein
MIHKFKPFVLHMAVGIMFVFAFQYIVFGAAASHTVGVTPNFDRTISPAKNVVTLYADQVPYSTILRSDKVPYALPLTDMRAGGDPLVIDWNGDGLSDLVFSKIDAPHSNSYDVAQYVLLNDGVNLTAAYLCQIKKDSNTGQQKRYWGDCADYSVGH